MKNLKNIIGSKMFRIRINLISVRKNFGADCTGIFNRVSSISINDVSNLINNSIQKNGKFK